MFNNNENKTKTNVMFVLVTNEEIISADLYMGFSDTMPMLMKYDLGENSHASFHLAPKISDEDDE